MPIIIAFIEPGIAPVDKVEIKATFRGGNFDHSVSSPLFFVGWRMHHAYSLAKNVESQVA